MRLPSIDRKRLNTLLADPRVAAGLALVLTLLLVALLLQTRSAS